MNIAGRLVLMDIRNHFYKRPNKVPRNICSLINILEKKIQELENKRKPVMLHVIYFIIDTVIF